MCISFAYWFIMSECIINIKIDKFYRREWSHFEHRMLRKCAKNIHHLQNVSPNKLKYAFNSYQTRILEYSVVHMFVWYCCFDEKQNNNNKRIDELAFVKSKVCSALIIEEKVIWLDLREIGQKNKWKSFYLPPVTRSTHTHSCVQLQRNFSPH